MFHRIFWCFFRPKNGYQKKHKKLGIPNPPPLIQEIFLKLTNFLSASRPKDGIYSVLRRGLPENFHLQWIQKKSTENNSFHSLSIAFEFRGLWYSAALKSLCGWAVFLSSLILSFFSGTFSSEKNAFCLRMGQQGHNFIFKQIRLHLNVQLG